MGGYVVWVQQACAFTVNWKLIDSGLRGVGAAGVREWWSALTTPTGSNPNPNPNPNPIPIPNPNPNPNPYPRRAVEWSALTTPTGCGSSTWWTRRSTPSSSRSTSTRWSDKRVPARLVNHLCPSAREE